METEATLQDASSSVSEQFKDLNIQFTELGVIIINTDGTMSKIPNWHELTDAERVKTIRLLGKRNAARKAALLAQQAEAEAEAEAVAVAGAEAKTQRGSGKQCEEEEGEEGSKASVEPQEGSTGEVLQLEN